MSKKRAVTAFIPALVWIHTSGRLEPEHTHTLTPGLLSLNHSKAGRSKSLAMSLGAKLFSHRRKIFLLRSFLDSLGGSVVGDTAPDLAEPSVASDTCERGVTDFKPYLIISAYSPSRTYLSVSRLSAPNVKGALAAAALLSLSHRMAGLASVASAGKDNTAPLPPRTGSARAQDESRARLHTRGSASITVLK